MSTACWSVFNVLLTFIQCCYSPWLNMVNIRWDSMSWYWASHSICSSSGVIVDGWLPDSSTLIHLRLGHVSTQQKPGLLFEVIRFDYYKKLVMTWLRVRTYLVHRYGCSYFQNYNLLTKQNFNKIPRSASKFKLLNNNTSCR